MLFSHPQRIDRDSPDLAPRSLHVGGPSSAGSALRSSTSAATSTTGSRRSTLRVWQRAQPKHQLDHPRRYRTIVTHDRLRAVTLDSAPHRSARGDPLPNPSNDRVRVVGDSARGTLQCSYPNGTRHGLTAGRWRARSADDDLYGGRRAKSTVGGDQWKIAEDCQLDIQGVDEPELMAP